MLRHWEDWKRILKRYKVIEPIGGHPFGTVCEAEDEETRERVAVTRCRRIFKDLVDCKRVLREVEIVSQLEHNNVIRLIELTVPDHLRFSDQILIVRELADSDIRKLCKQDVKLDPAHVKLMMYNFLTGLLYIHSAGICHCDLKPASCFVNQDCTVKIGDFGLARATRKEDANPAGTNPQVRPVLARWYRAPEQILLQQNQTNSIDLWSAGCIYAQLIGMLEGIPFLDRGPLFQGISCFPLPHRLDRNGNCNLKDDMFSRVFSLIGKPSPEEVAALDRDDAKQYVSSCFGARPATSFQAVFPHVDQAALDLLGQMLRFSPGSRISAHEALRHPLLRDIRDEEKERVALEPVRHDLDEEAELTEASLRQRWLQEIRKYHPEVPET